LKPAVIKGSGADWRKRESRRNKIPNNEEEAQRFAEELLDLTIKDHKVRKLLVEKKVSVAQELYVGITIDRSEGKPILLASAKGGIDVEEIARKYPEEMIREELDVFEGLPNYKALEFARRMVAEKESGGWGKDSEQPL